MDKNKFLNDLTTIENQLNLFTYDTYDKTVSKNIKRNLFALVKVSGSFDEYLPQINQLTFKPTDVLYSEPHHIVREHFDSTKSSLLTIIDMIRRETQFGKLDDIELVKPSTITVPWLWKNLSVKNILWLLGIVVFVASSAYTLGSYVSS
ncbi:TPA: hypothetical protein I7259_11445 [Vibrio parahaemolyticus]|nr:hypothetical protein [Vibrio parahaemolyticus]EKA7417482.1 hypothetical protein [Vibrio parahaemolyticus]ELA9330809.1 hypothetical protein [Vibrio parahaemolyticus]HAS6644258.1 hypothetical protein [Vibrio parahaemolyticus]